MSEQNNIDKYFKERLYSRDFNFDERAWKDAEKLLDKHDRNYRGGWKNSLYGLIALLFISGAVYLGVRTLYTPADDMAEKPVSFALSEQTVVEAVPDEVIAIEELPAAPVEQQDVSQVDSRNDAQTASSGPAIGSHSGKAPVQHLGVNKIRAQPNNKATVSESPVPAMPVAEKKKTRVERKGTEKNSDVADNGGGSIASGSVASPGTYHQRKRISEISPSDASSAFASQSPMRREEVVLERMESLMPEFVVEHEKDILKGKMELKQKKDRFSSSMLSRWGILAGAGYGIGPNVPQDDASVGRITLLYGGVRYTHYLSSKFSIHGNLLYKHISKVDVNVQLESQTFDFGYNSEQITVRSRKLSYIEVPLYLNYYLGGRYNLYAGGQYAHLAGVLSDKNTTYQNSFDNMVEESKDQHGYRDHMAKYYLSLLAGAEYLINERLAIGIRYNRGITDLGNKKYIDNGGYSLDELKLTININLGK